jgi:hypothetical protein
MNANIVTNPRSFSKCVNKIRTFFLRKNFIEVPSPCEINTLQSYNFPTEIISSNGQNNFFYPSNSEGLSLDNILLDEISKGNFDSGYFCVSTNYKNKKNSLKISPLFEFTSKGNMSDLIKLEKELLDYLKFPKRFIENSPVYEDFAPNDLQGVERNWAINSIGCSMTYPDGDYTEMANMYKVNKLSDEHNTRIGKEYGPVFFLKNPPIDKNKFWNSGKGGVNVILEGVQTIVSGERSSDVNEMRERFEKGNDGCYANTLYHHFGKEKVQKELDEYLSKDFFERYYGSISLSEVISAIF